MIKRTLLLFVILTLIAQSVYAAASDYPSWWYDMGLIDARAASAGNRAPVNQGQLKNIALRAEYYLQFKLGLTANQWDSQWASVYSDAGLSTAMPSFTNTGNNYAVINQGQAKNVVWGFYQMLYTEISHNDVRAMLGNHMPDGVWNYDYPWTGTSSSNSSPLLIGQLKFMFCFDLGEIGDWMDMDGDGVDDRIEWQMYNGLGAINSNVSLYTDTDGDLFVQMIELLANGGTSSFSSDALSNGWNDALGRYRETTGSKVVIVLPDRGIFAAEQPDMILEGL